MIFCLFWKIEFCFEKLTVFSGLTRVKNQLFVFKWMSGLEKIVESLFFFVKSKKYLILNDGIQCNNWFFTLEISLVSVNSSKLVPAYFLSILLFFRRCYLLQTSLNSYYFHIHSFFFSYQLLSLSSNRIHSLHNEENWFA